MESKASIIAHNLIESLKDTLKISRTEIKGESFNLIFHAHAYSFIFFCSLHHLDMPWKIEFKVEKNYQRSRLEKVEQIIKVYEITPIFLADVNLNAKKLAEKIKLDIIEVLESWKFL